MTPLANVAALVGAGVVCLAAAVTVLIRQRRIFEVIPSSNVTMQMPTKWDDNEITKLLQRHQEQPQLLTHVVSSIKSRMILNQDSKTAQRRLQLMANVIEVFKLGREMQGILHDIHLEEKEFEIKQVETEIRKEDVEARQKSEGQLRKLRKQRDELHLKKEIAQLQQDIKTTEKAPDAEPRLTPDQQRRLKRMDIEDKIRGLERREEEALAGARGEEDQMRIKNMHADKREELREQLSKYLV